MRVILTIFALAALVKAVRADAPAPDGVVSPSAATWSTAPPPPPDASRSTTCRTALTGS